MVTARDLGMEAVSEDQTIGLRYPKTMEDAVATASRLWRYDVERREFLIGSVFAAGAVSAASRDWLIGSPREELAYTGTGTHVSMSDVEQVRALGDEFERLSHTFGSQRIRRHMVNYLRYDVGPLLKKSRSDKVGRELLNLAAEFTAAAGYMAVDCNELSLAERYYIQALGLANAADSRSYGAQVMATHMGHLALYADHPREAVQLAEAARAGTRNGDEPLATAVTWVVEARGYARMGEARACQRALSQAERHFCRSNPSEAPQYLQYFQQAYLSDAFAHCFRDLDQPDSASKFAALALRDLPQTHTRRRAINTGILAHASLHKKEPAEAAAHGIEVVQLTQQLHSPRALSRVARLRRDFIPHQKDADVATFLEEADGLLKRASV
ncbi:transcriptional regulator [Streptomyces sp. NPDC046862]|uniref:transcriptional regulator n=1 Tax=Streptomyces sp. NPDC046862 TaxID=3154603 RepID=UPI00345258CD